MDVIASEAKQSQLFKGWRLPRPLPWPRNDNSSNYVQQTTSAVSEKFVLLFMAGHVIPTGVPPRVFLSKTRAGEQSGGIYLNRSLHFAYGPSTNARGMLTSVEMPTPSEKLH